MKLTSMKETSRNLLYLLFEKVNMLNKILKSHDYFNQSSSNQTHKMSTLCMYLPKKTFKIFYLILNVYQYVTL